MKTIFVVTIHWDYDGSSLMAIRESQAEAEAYAELNAMGDTTQVDEYPIDFDEHNPEYREWPKTVAVWKQDGYGAKFKRTK